MIYKVSPEGVEVFAPLLRELIEREQVRGDVLQLEPLLKRLVNGSSFALAVYASPEYPIPLLLMICRQSRDTVREQDILWVDHVLVPHSSDVRANLPALQEDFKAFTRRYPVVRFVSDNPAMPRFLNEVGILNTEIARLYELKAAPDGN